MRTPTVTILSSVDPLLREAAVGAVRAQRPALAVIRHELATVPIDSSAHRVVDIGTTTLDTRLEVDASCCLSCLLREDTIEALGAWQAHDVLLVLPPSVEAASVARGLTESGAAHIEAIVMAVSSAGLLDALVADRPIADIDAVGDDPRSIAEILGRGLEVADVVLVDDRDQEVVPALPALAPHALILPVTASVDDWIGTARHDPVRLAASLEPGVPRSPAAVASDHRPLQRVVWHHRRPIHPDRLVAALGSDALAGVVRASGSLWVATRPATAMSLEIAGSCCELGAVDAWIAAVPDWPRVEPTRAAVARERWHPYYGDRAQDLVLIIERDGLAPALEELDACLLTDEELAEGADTWAARTDPFVEWLGDEEELLAGAVGPEGPER
ncbi:MAG: GTP-binding protein [Nitriliruptoraceae bacterium]|nr:GTP-binding protein [Nitriliruptoraceae bacterium]